MHHHVYINLRTKDVLVNGQLVHCEARYTITPQGRQYLAQLRVEQETAERGADEKIARDVPTLTLSADDGPRR